VEGLNSSVVTAEPYFRHDLAYVHERGYGLHGERCAPGVLHSRGVSASVRSSFGQETLPPGLKTIVGTRR
jgi:hypothetical protein